MPEFIAPRAYNGYTLKFVSNVAIADDRTLNDDEIMGALAGFRVTIGREGIPGVEYKLPVKMRIELVRSYVNEYECWESVTDFNVKLVARQWVLKKEFYEKIKADDSEASSDDSSWDDSDVELDPAVQIFKSQNTQPDKPRENDAAKQPN